MEACPYSSVRAVKPGSEFTYWLEAKDNHRPLGNTASSARFRLTIQAPVAPSVAEQMRQEDLRRQDETQLADAGEQQSQISNEASDRDSNGKTDEEKTSEELAQSESPPTETRNNDRTPDGTSPETAPNAGEGEQNKSGEENERQDPDSPADDAGRQPDSKQEARPNDEPSRDSILPVKQVCRWKIDEKVSGKRPGFPRQASCGRSDLATETPQSDEGFAAQTFPASTTTRRESVRPGAEEHPSAATKCESRDRTTGSDISNAAVRQRGSATRPEKRIESAARSDEQPDSERRHPPNPRSRRLPRNGRIPPRPLPRPIRKLRVANLRVVRRKLLMRNRLRIDLRRILIAPHRNPLSRTGKRPGTTNPRLEATSRGTTSRGTAIRRTRIRTNPRSRMPLAKGPNRSRGKNSLKQDGGETKPSEKSGETKAGKSDPARKENTPRQDEEKRTAAERKRSRSRTASVRKPRNETRNRAQNNRRRKNRSR